MKAIIMDIQDGEAVVLLDNSTFKKIPSRRDYEVGQEISLGHRESCKENATQTIESKTDHKSAQAAGSKIIKHLHRLEILKTPFAKYTAVAASFFLLIGVSMTAYRIMATPVSYIYMDINPSFRIDLNRLDRIVKVNPLNTDAEDLLNVRPIRDKNTQKCISMIVVACKEQTYINENNIDIEISVRTNHKALSKTVEKEALKLREVEKLQVSVYSIDEQENKEIMECKKPASWRKAVVAYTEYFGGDVNNNMKLLDEKTADEINALIADAKQTAETAAVMAAAEQAKAATEQSAQTYDVAQGEIATQSGSSSNEQASTQGDAQVQQASNGANNSSSDAGSKKSSKKSSKKKSSKDKKTGDEPAEDAQPEQQPAPEPTPTASENAMETVPLPTPEIPAPADLGDSSASENDVQPQPVAPEPAPTPVPTPEFTPDESQITPPEPTPEIPIPPVDPTPQPTPKEGVMGVQDENLDVINQASYNSVGER